MQSILTTFAFSLYQKRRLTDPVIIIIIFLIIIIIIIARSNAERCISCSISVWASVKRRYCVNTNECRVIPSWQRVAQCIKFVINIIIRKWSPQHRW